MTDGQIGSCKQGVPVVIFFVHGTYRRHRLVPDFSGASPLSPFMRHRAGREGVATAQDRAILAWPFTRSGSPSPLHRLRRIAGLGHPVTVPRADTMKERHVQW